LAVSYYDEPDNTKHFTKVMGLLDNNFRRGQFAAFNDLSKLYTQEVNHDVDLSKIDIATLSENKVTDMLLIGL
jgi:hypothetical protein